MLVQRTRAEQAAEVFNTFRKQYPNPYALARSSLGEVQEVIEPLGLHWRAKWIYRLGQKLVTEYDGEVPETLEELTELPGIGPYAAGAFLSLHQNTWAIIPDANMVRILGRFFGRETHAETRRNKEFLQLCKEVTPEGSFKQFNYAIIDFGREVCTPKDPACMQCPLNNRCSYFKTKTG